MVSDETKQKTSSTCKRSECGKWRKGQPMSEKTRQRRKQLSSVKVGATFGESIVESLLEEVLMSGRLRQKVGCRCSCGELYETIDIYLWRGEGLLCPKCLSTSHRLYEVGYRSDKLVVIGYESEGHRRKAICKCDCGKVIRIRPSLLGVNKTNNCGCSPRGGWEGVGELSKSYYTRTKRGAKLRDLEFMVSMEYLWGLYQSQSGKCALSGVPIGLNTLPHGGGEASLDRKDNSKGYIEGNVQWVHKDLNRMKLDLNQARFIELCKEVVSHLVVKGSPTTAQPTLDTGCQ